jgi:hypothetical protein
MHPGARTPEELEALLEDAFVTRDREALAELFEDGAVLVNGRVCEARGGEAIGRLAAVMWDREYAYLADPRRVLQARDTALVLAERGISVVRRRDGGGWRYAISLLESHYTNERRRR